MHVEVDHHRDGVAQVGGLVQLCSDLERAVHAVGVRGEIPGGLGRAAAQGCQQEHRERQYHACKGTPTCWDAMSQMHAGKVLLFGQCR